MKNKKWWSLLILMSSIAYGTPENCDTANVLTQIRPGAAWTLHGDSVKGLKWLDTKQKKPTASEIQKGKQACIADTETRQARKAQARLDVKNPVIPVEKKVEQLILLLDLDK